MTVPDEAGRPVPDPALEVAPSGGPSPAGWAAVALVAAVSVAVVVAVGLHLAGGR